MKWIDELKVRFTHTDNIDKNVFSWLLVLVSVVLKKNDNGEGYDWKNCESDVWRQEICLYLSTMDYDVEMKEVVSALVELLMKKEYEL